MTTVPLGVRAFNRTYGQEPEIALLNRFFEENPTNQVEGVALLTRPGSTFFVGAGIGPIRVMGHQPGVHDGDLFIVSGSTLYRYDGVSPPEVIAGTIAGTGTPSMAFVAGPSYNHLFIADGSTLQLYTGLSSAIGTLTSSGAGILAADTVELNGTYYAWTAGSVDAGTPAGTLAFPYLVDLGINDTEALANLLQAINLTGVAGTTYSTATQVHPSIEGVLSTATTLRVQARTPGTAGNLLTTTETGVNIAWAAATLEGGGTHSLSGVVTPDDAAIVSLGTIASFVICVVAVSQRFYYIRPAEVTIDPLDFAEAEMQPDEIVEVVIAGDGVYFLGVASSEVWYVSNSALDPFIRQQGLAFSQGILEGTTVRINTRLITVAGDGIVYEISSGPVPLSDPPTAERIRLWRKTLGI